MGDAETLILCEDVGKKFCRDLKKSLWYGVKDSAGDLLRKKPSDSLRDGEFWANHDIGFALKRGECLGLIGRNGAGKTTLLKMLNGLIKPDRGQIKMRGNVAAMIALGAGFNPVLTARENVFVNGSILGLSKRQIADKLDEIIDFAEIPEFADAPVRSFSSGMQVRLGFGIAAILIRPDILLLDEVLAVGDMGFKIKCLNRVRELSQNSAVILVSHTMQMIGSFCTRALVMKDGAIDLDASNVGTAIDHYNALFALDVSQSTTGNGSATLDDVSLLNDVIDHSSNAESVRQSTLNIEVRFTIHSGDAQELRLIVKTASAEHLLTLTCHTPNGQKMLFNIGKHAVSVQLPVKDLVAGQYTLAVVLRDTLGNCAFRADGIGQFRVRADQAAWGHLVRRALASSSNQPQPN